MNLSQAEFSQKAGVSLRSITNFESGSDVKFSNFIKILKALELADNLEVLVPDVSKRPSTFLVTEKQKQRVRKSGRNMDISLPRIKSIISEVKETVLKWPQIASETGIRKETYEGIQSIITVTINEVFE